MNVKALLIPLLIATGADAQGFAGLGTSDDGFALPNPAVRFSYPEDHASHPDFRIEWWYLTANLQDREGTPYGIQWTLFRNGLRPGGAPRDQVWMGHAAISAPEGHFVAERLARGGIGQAGVTGTPFEAYIDEWLMAGPSLSDIQLTAQGSDFAYDLSLKADGPFVEQGDNGYSVKSQAGQASHYYSQPFYNICGTLTLPSGDVDVAGQGWLDREWSSAPLTTTQTGWDWVSLHLESGAKLMGYRLRDEDGSAYTVGTWITANGQPTHLGEGEIIMTPRALSDVDGRKVPTTWQVDLPSRDLSVTATAIYPQSWMDTLVPYWEGPVQVKGTHPGIGYLEMTGYE